MKIGQFEYEKEKGELLNVDTAERQVLRQKLNTLLAYLIEKRERVVSKDELLEALWDNGEYRESSLTQSIRELRVALGDSAQNPSFIKTYQQRGYQWICPIVAESGDTSKAQLTDAQAEKTTALRWLAWGAFAIAVLALAVVQLWPQKMPADTSASPSSLMVLPVINESGDQAQDWVELGLADMLAVEIQRSGRLRVTPPATANAMLFDAELPWPSLPAQLRLLMAEHNIDVALYASFRVHNEQQVLDFQLLYRDGRTQQGALSYSSLPESVSAIANQIQYMVRPESENGVVETNKAKVGQSTSDKLAMQALAEGMSALQTSGPQAAHDFFQASYLLNKDEAWVRVYLAQTEILLGRWPAANEKLDALLFAEKDDSSLRAFAHYLKADLAHRQRNFVELEQHLSQAIALAEHIQNIQVMADSYRLKARVHWRKRQWQEHQYWLDKSAAIFPRGADIRIEAEKLFYLGNPIAYGLEIDPQQDLLLSRSRIEQAKNFYAQLGNRSALAATEFALAQNYTLSTVLRDKSLQAAIDAYRDLAMPYELSEVLIYAAFYKLQFRKGAEALAYIDEASSITSSFDQFLLSDELAFYEAFAYLDMGLDQSVHGLHGRNEELLEVAKNKFSKLIAPEQESEAKANALIMLAWAEMDLGETQQAKQYLTLAMEIYRERNMSTTLAYAVYSLMKLRLDEGDYQGVLNLGEEAIHSRQQLSYLARAHYELGQFQKATSAYQRIADEFNWTDEDERKLSMYRQAEKGMAIALPDELPAHSAYCESDWFQSFN